MSTIFQYKLVSSTKAFDVIPIEKYISEKTGITVIIASVEGPQVNGFICLGTEAHNDDSLPHTLKKLIFLGSERYPYKGILKLVANRCLAKGINAWSENDHTYYTVYTIGDGGILSFLPIYLDHILKPTLTDQGFITEVHHIDGEGEDAGVMYCEMQETENTAALRCDSKLVRAMYPDSRYSAETGVITENIRISTDNIKVKNFHNKFYRPENLTIILAGQIEAEDVFKALEGIEDDIIAKREMEPGEDFIKPWKTIPPMPQYGEYEVQWPADTELDFGRILFGWCGPLLTEPGSLKDLAACNVLLRYLCDTAAAPLHRCLIRKEDAYAELFWYDIIENIAPLIKIELYNVPIQKLTAARNEVLQCLKIICSGEDVIDIDRLKRLICKELREAKASLELSPHHAIATRCIGDVLYSQNNSDFISRMNPQQDLHTLLEESPEYWLGLLQKYFTDDVVIIMGSPSIELQAKMAADEKTRLERQRAKLGETGLAVKAKKLKQAMEFNERPPPSGILADVPLLSCDSVKFHNISTWSTDGLNCPHFNLKNIPIYTRVHSLKTSFVFINLIFDMTTVDRETRQWLPLHMNGLSECPVRRGDTLIPHEEVMSTNEELIGCYGYHIGIEQPGNFSVGEFGNFVQIEVMCEPNDYEAVVNHLYEILFAAEITKERLLVFVQRFIDIAAKVRILGDVMVYDTLRDSVYSEDSNVHWCTVLRQQKFLKDLLEQLNAGGDSADAALREAKRTFTNITRNAWLHLAADFDRYKLSTEVWKRFGKSTDTTPSPPRLYWDAELVSGFSGGFVIGVGGWESCCVVHMSPGPLGHRAADVAPLMIALNYFTKLLDPMRRPIRGCGLSCSYVTRMSQNEGRLIFSLCSDSTSNAAQSYCKAKSILNKYLNEGILDEDMFASAKKTALFEVVENEQSPSDVVRRSLINYLQREGETYNRDLVQAISAVTEDAAHAAAVKWLPTLFDLNVSKLAIACHPAKVNDMHVAFDKMGIKLDAFESMEASHFNK